jgi:hypothetical protein
MRRLLLLLLLLAGPALGQAPAELDVFIRAPASLGIPSGANARHERLAGLAIPAQRDALRGLLGPVAESCPSLSGAYFAGLDADGAAHWDVRCGNRTAWRISLPAEASATPQVTPCPVQTELCFLPAPRVAGDLGTLRQARCAAACELRAGTERQSCLASCLRGTEGIAALGGPGSDRHIAIFVVDLPLMTEGFLAGARTSNAALDSARRACEAMAGGRPCRIAVSTINHCAAVVQAPDSQVSAGFGIELDDAEREARRVCGAGAACQLIISGC